MVDVLTKKQRSYCMSKILGRDTKIELLFRRYIRCKGIRNYRVKNNLIGKPDIILPKLEIAIFCDGCFWHKCPKCYVEPKSNKDFWIPKINKNIKRDRIVNRELRKKGWKVIRFWEHEIKKFPEECYKRLLKVVNIKLKKEGVKLNRTKKIEGLNVIDLFCGAGGLSEGFQQAGLKVVLGVDNQEKFTKTFSKNHKNAKVITGDIRDITVGQLKKETGNKKIHIVVGGPPCQGFSLAGRRDQKDPRNSLFMEFIRVVNGFKPKFFVMENVRGILSMKTDNNKMVIDIIEDEFEKIGYKIKYKTLTASDYGVPQKRKRVIFIGTNTNKDFDHPFPSHANRKWMQQKLDKGNILPWIGVGKVLLDKEKVAKNFFHTPKMIEGFKRRKEKHLAKGNGFGAQFLKMDEPSYTISARYWKDGSDALVKYSEDEIRMLTPLECARIQSFPDEYEFVGSKRDIYTQIGNAVPPLLGKAIAEELKKYFN